METNSPTFQSLLSAARRAEGSGDLSAALIAWNAVRAQFPDLPDGYLGTATCLQKARRSDEADELLGGARLRFGDDPAILETYASLAHWRGEWPEAHARWLAFRHRFPDALIGYAADAVTLRSLGRFDQAEAVYRFVLKRWPIQTELDFLADHAELAQARGDLDEGSRRWAALRAQFPESPKCYVRDAANLSAGGRHEEAEVLLREAIARWPDEPTCLIEFAHVAQRCGNFQQRLERWQHVCAKCPDRIDGYLGAGHALFEMKRLADAAKVLQLAIGRFPESDAVAELGARIAFASDEYADALHRCESFRQRFPAHPAGYSGAIDASLALARYAEAARLGDRARELFPQDLEIAVAWCSIPEQVKNLPECERRWRLASEQFPMVMRVTARHARSLLQLKRWDDAERLLQAALIDHGDDIDLLRIHAECAGERGDWAAAESRWQKVIQQFPDSPAGRNGLGDLLRRAGRLQESAGVLSEGLERFSNDEDLEQSLAWTFTVQRAWPEALRRWERLSHNHPKRPSVVSGTIVALTQAEQDLAVNAGVGPQAFEIPAGLRALREPHEKSSLDFKELFLQFESLGDDCEFGLMQRRFGAEPMGLLRWAVTPIDRLIDALDSRLRDVGEAEYTRVEAVRGEYVTWDTRYSMRTQILTRDEAESASQFEARHLRRIRYLRRKLLEDLEAGTKVFVYKSDTGLSERDARALHAALRRYNDRAALLCVVLGVDGLGAGALEELSDGLFIGTIDRFSTVDYSIDVWAELCRKTLEARTYQESLQRTRIAS